MNAPNREKVHVRVGPELFGPGSAGKYAFIGRALYGLKTAAAAWQSHFQDMIINVLGYKWVRYGDTHTGYATDFSLETPRH